MTGVALVESALCVAAETVFGWLAAYTLDMHQVTPVFESA